MNWIRCSLFVLLVSLLIASTASAARVHRDMRDSRLAEITLTSKLDLKVIEEAGGIVDYADGRTARVYLLEGDADALRARGFPVIWIRDEAKEYGRALWESTRHERNVLDDYHTNDEIAALFATWQATYPDYFRYESIGQSVEGRPIWAAKVSDNVTVDEPEIEVKYVANIHGDEVVGKENCLRFIEEVLTQHTTVPDYEELLTDFEMWFVPLMNPDGHAHVTRYNANGVDLNRDFPDRCDDSVNTTTGRQIETAHMMNWSALHTFTLSANFHGGSLVTNYPWDNNCSGGSVYAPTPEDCLFVNISRRYCEANPRMRVNTEFMYPDTGITNGADWYEVSGGMQDWNYVWMGDRDLTIELDNTKWPAASRLESLWQENRLAMRYYFLEAKYGVRGFVTDSLTGEPVRATITVNSIVYPTFSSALHGDYFRTLRPGTYSLTFAAAGYQSKTITSVVVPAGSYTVRNVQLAPLPRPQIAVSPTALATTILPCSEAEVPLTIFNNGEVALTWSSAGEDFQQSTHCGNAVGGGWRWMDSDTSGGPAYQWRDISAVGTQVSFTGDDQTLGPFNIGFTFPYYGQNFTTYRICSNGWISFSSTSTSYSNSDLPNASAPVNMLAAWWDDLSPQNGGQVRCWSNNADSAVVSFVNVPSYSGGGLYTFQIVLLSSGKFVFQYSSMGTNRLNSATIGFQNANGQKGEAVIYNQYYVHNNLAIAFCPSPMVELAPASGNVPAHSSQNVVARFHSCCLPTTAAGVLTISSNDPLRPALAVPVSLEIVTSPPARVEDLVIVVEGEGIRLSWSAAAFATGYLVYRMTDATQDIATGELLTPVPITATTYLDSTPAALQAFYQVVSVR